MTGQDLKAVKALNETSAELSLSKREKHLIGLAVTLTLGCTVCSTRRFTEALQDGISKQELKDKKRNKMNTFQIDFFGMSLMNNTPIHLIVGIVMICLLVFGAFFATEEQKDKVIKIMIAWFIIVLLTGVYIWTLVDFSIPLLIKSLFATIAFVIMLKLLKILKI